MTCKTLPKHVLRRSESVQQNPNNFRFLSPVWNDNGAQLGIQ
jgi:hypothetical protein